MSDDDTIRSVETEWWRLDLPEEWYAEQDEEVIVIGDQDGIGALEFSTLHKEEGQTSAGDLAELMAEMEAAPSACEPVRLGPFQGYSLRSRDEDNEEALREWWLSGGSLLLYITYSCHFDHAGYDDACVDEILQTLDFSAPAVEV